MSEKFRKFFLVAVAHDLETKGGGEREKVHVIGFYQFAIKFTG